MKYFKKAIVILICLLSGLALYFAIQWKQDQQLEEIALIEEQAAEQLLKEKLPAESLAKTKAAPLPDLDLILLGTIVDPSSPSLAWIKDIPSGYADYYKVGDRIKDCRLTKVELGRVEVLRGNGRKEYLRVEQALLIDQGVIDAEAIISEYQNPNNILNELSFLPEVSAGKIEGFRLTRIAEQSIVKEVGFEIGDVLKDINGYKLTSIKDAKEFYEQLKTGYKQGTIKTLEVGLDRDGQAQRMIFSVK